MRYQRLLALFASLGALMATNAWAQSCTHVQGYPWYDVNGELWYLTQADPGNGAWVSGYVEPNNEWCASQWPVTGYFGTNGQFSLTAQNPVPGWCSAWVEWNGVVTIGGCDAAPVDWTNSGSQTGSSQWYKGYNETPSTEVTQTDSWEVNWPWRTTHYFKATLFSPSNPSYYGPNYGGRFVGEWTAATGTDTCYYEGSNKDPQVSIPNGTGTVLPNRSWYVDRLGWREDIVTFYREAGRAPCSFTNYQQMRIDCYEYYLCPYKQNTLIAHISATQVTNWRDNVPASKVWP